MGADVIKVEEPETGDYMRWTPPLVDGQSAIFNAVNRNKRSITLNLKSEAGRDLLLRLVETADVLVEGNRPGVMDRLKLGWDVIHARNPRLVMCSITGYGQDGPFALHAGHDLNYMAIAGALGLNGERDRPPVPLAVQVADIGGGSLYPAVAILGSLLAVKRGDEGRWIDSSMTDGAMSFLTTALAAHAAGEKAVRGEQRLTGRYPCYRIYECKGGGFYSVGALEPKFWATLCKALGRPELVELHLAEDADAHRKVEGVFATRTREEWEMELAGLDVCCEPVLSLDEVASHPQVVARRLLETHGGRVEVRPVVPLGKGYRRRNPPGLGEHNAEVLSEVGVDATELKTLAGEGVI
jgi:crotonobetainyl-CoA:carnitine CoA-transferase CaiB-like acyl-CoA transferase